MSNENKHPLVSVCVITYNHEEYLRDAIDSIIGQKTNFQIEIVIGEDFSTDTTRTICEGYEKRYPEIIKLLPSERNLGVTPNLIRTLSACSGKYIALCEGDDYWNDFTKIQKQADYLESNVEFVACYHSVKVVDSNGTIIRKSKNSSFHDRDISSEELMMGRVMSLSSLCFRNVIKEYPEEFYKSPAGDNFICSLLGNYGRGKFISDIEPSAYRMHAEGIWSKKNEDQKKMLLVNSYFWLWQYYLRIGKSEYSVKFYNRIMLEGFYSDPFKMANVSPFLGKFEMYLIKAVRRIFRLLRRVF